MMLYFISWCHYLRHYHHRHRRLLPVEREEICQRQSSKHFVISRVLWNKCN